MWRYLFLCPIYLLASSLPLLIPVGTNFEYEYVLLSSYAILVLVPIAGLLIPRKQLISRLPEFTFPTSFELLWILILGPLVGLMPAIYGFWIHKCPCSESGFWFWIVLLWYPSWVLAHAFQHLIIRAQILKFNRAILVIGLFLSYLGLISLVAVVIWFNPQKHAVNLLAGFLHGPIYDDFIAVDDGIVLARLSHLLLALTLLFLAWLRKSFFSVFILLLLSVSWIGTSIVASRYPSVSVGADSLNQLLSGRLEGNGFTLHYFREGQASEKPSLSIERLFRDAQFHVSELREVFSNTQIPHVEIYAYKDQTQKKLWFGGGDTDVTDVYTPSIHITEGSWPHVTLRHELVHAMLSKIAFHGLGFHPNVVFTEGFAVALAPEERTLSLDDSAASLVISNRIPSLETLFSPLFWKESPFRAYVAAGSFIKFLIETRGFDQVRTLYSGNAWEDVFKESMGDTIAEWKEKILAKFDREKHELQTEALFRYPGILNDVCPHSKADLRKGRTENIYIRLRQPPGWNVERDYLSWQANLDPEDRSSKILYIKKEILKDVTAKFATLSYLLPKISKWKLILSTQKTWPPQTVDDIEIRLLESDLQRLAEQKVESLAVLEELKKLDSTKKLGSSITRKIWSRWKVEKDLPDHDALQWRRYLAGWAVNPPEKKSSDETWILTYLRLRALERNSESSYDPRGYLRMEPDSSLPDCFTIEWSRILGISLMRSGHYEDARQLFKKTTELSSYSKDLFVQYTRWAEFYGKIEESP